MTYFEELELSLKNEIKVYKGIRGIARMIRILSHFQKTLKRSSDLYWASSDLEIGNIIDS